MRKNIMNMVRKNEERLMAVMCIAPDTLLQNPIVIEHIRAN